MLPPEGDFLAIILDALGGNDEITVGPTVQKTVSVDAGPGDDRVEILSGNVILIDQSTPIIVTVEDDPTNDTPADLAADLNAALATVGLGDRLRADVNDEGKIRLSAVEHVGIASLQISAVENDPALTKLRFTDGQSSTASLAEAVSFVGLTIDSPDDADWYQFSLLEPGNGGGGVGQLKVTSSRDSDELSVQIHALDTSGQMTRVQDLALERQSVPNRRR